MRIVIIGGPLVGKTTLGELLAEAMAVGVGLRSTDDFIDLKWSEQSEKVGLIFDRFLPGEDLVVEGTAAVRGLRKWMKENRGAPCDLVIFLTKIYGVSDYTTKHRAMAKGIDTIFREIENELRARGVRVLEER